ncbi:MAG: class I SAM-dependent methyltransferase [Promethearchaeota archaeon]
MKPLNKDLDKKKNIIEKYNSTSSFYDNRYSKIQKEKYRILFRNCNLNYKTILDAGCGTGLLIEYVHDLSIDKIKKKVKYIGIDISWKMLINFSNKTKKIKDIEDINLILGDIENLPLRHDSFNVLFSITSLQNLPVIKKGLGELIRVGQKDSLLKLSILQKQLKLDDLITYLRAHTIDLKTEFLENIEDVIIQGSLIKH